MPCKEIVEECLFLIQQFARFVETNLKLSVIFLFICLFAYWFAYLFIWHSRGVSLTDPSWEAAKERQL